MALRHKRITVDTEAKEINVAPLIDMVFILLIFFLVTTSFVTEPGVTVDRAKAATATALERESILIAIDARGRLFMDGNAVRMPILGALVRQQAAATDRPVIIIADSASRHDILMSVIDECKKAGAKKISLAAERKK
jgi:biopolymer transport protein ExbD